MPSAHFKAVSFDWGDTLAANTGMPYRANQIAAFGRFAEDLTALGCVPAVDFVDACRKDVDTAWWDSVDLQKNPEGREMDFAGLFRMWIERLNQGGGIADHALIQLAVNRCQDSLVDVLQVFGETEHVLRELKRRGYRIGILSHIIWPGPACRRWFVRHGLAPFVDFYSLSSEVGFVKPHPKHYQDTLDQAGCMAHELLHVGDHPLRDIFGARDFGFRTCIKETGAIHSENHVVEAVADYRILCLTDLLRLLP